MRKLRPRSHSKWPRQNSKPGLPQSGATFRTTVAPCPLGEWSSAPLGSLRTGRKLGPRKPTPIPATKKPFPTLMTFFVFVDYVTGDGTERRQGSWARAHGQQGWPSHPSQQTLLPPPHPPAAEPREGAGMGAAGPPQG